MGLKALTKSIKSSAALAVFFASVSAGVGNGPALAASASGLSGCLVIGGGGNPASDSTISCSNNGDGMRTVWGTFATVDSVNNAFNQIQTTINSTATDLSGIQSSINSLTNSSNYLGSQVVNLNNLTKTYGERLDVLQQNDIWTINQAVERDKVLQKQIDANSGLLENHTIHLNGLDQRATQTEKNLSGLTATMQGYGSRIATNETNIGSLQTASANHQATLNDHDSRITATEKNVSDLTGTVQAYGGRIATNETKIASLDQKTASQQTLLDNYGSRLSTTEQNITAINATDAAQQAQLSLQSAQISQTNTNVSALSTSVQGLGGRVTKNEGDIADLKNAVATGNTSTATQLGEVGKQVDANTKSIADLNTKTDGQQVQINTNAEGIADLNTKTDGQQVQINTNAKGIADLSAKTDAQQGQLDNHEGRITKNTDDIAKLSTASGAQQAQLDSQGKQIDTNTKDIADLSAKTDAQQGQLDNHEGRITKNTDDIASQGKQIDTNTKDIAALSTSAGSQQGQLNNHEGRITAAETTLVDHGGRLSQAESEIASLNSGAVFYNKNAARSATGAQISGVTLNDGSGQAVLISNLAAGQSARDAVNVAQLTSAVSAFGGGAGVDDKGNVIAPTYTIGGQQYNNVGDALKATNEIGVQYTLDDKGKRTNDITLSGTGSGPVAIHNVADGKAASDAATVGQLRSIGSVNNSYTDARMNEMAYHVENRFSALSGEIAKSRAESRGGIASAMAMAALRYDDRPGKLSFASGVGNFRGASALTAGLGYTSESGDFRFNAAISHAWSTRDTSLNAGMSWTLN